VTLQIKKRLLVWKMDWLWILVKWCPTSSFPENHRYYRKNDLTYLVHSYPYRLRWKQREGEFIRINGLSYERVLAMAVGFSILLKHYNQPEEDLYGEFVWKK
jgi:hypothetical protein